jgi:hypothetical protein
MGTAKQRAILDCWDKTETTASFAICAAQDSVSPQALAIANCTAQFNKDHVTSDFAKCISGSQFGEIP